MAGITLVKAINATGGINQFLLTGKKWVAFRTNFDVQIVFHSRACFKVIAARASYCNFGIIRMNFRFHFVNGLLCWFVK